MNNIIKKTKIFFFIILGVAIPTSIAGSSITLGVISFLWILEGGYRNKFMQLVSSKWALALLALIIYYGFGVLWGDNHNNSTWIFQKILLWIGLIILTTANFSQNTLRFGAIAFLITTFFSALVAILIDFSILKPLHNYLSIISDHSVDHKSAFIKYNYHNLLLAFSAVLSFYLLIERETKYRFVLFVMIFVYSWSLFSEAGRAGHLIFLFCSLFYVIYYIKQKPIFTIIGSIILVVGLLVAYNFSHSFKVRIKEGLETILNEGQRPGQIKDHRYVFVEETINYIKQKPIFGYGTGSFGTIFDREVKTPQHHRFYTHTTPHNNYLYVWFELGILGILFFLLIFYYQIKELLLFKDWKHRLILPLMFLTIMLVDSYFFISILSTFYIYFYTIYSQYSYDKLV